MTWPERPRKANLIIRYLHFSISAGEMKKNMIIWKAAVSCWYLPRLFWPCFTQGARKLHAILKTIGLRTCGWLARQHVQVWTVLDWVTRCSAAYSVQHYFTAAGAGAGKEEVCSWWWSTISECTFFYIFGVPVSLVGEPLHFSCSLWPPKVTAQHHQPTRSWQSPAGVPSWQMASLHKLDLNYWTCNIGLTWS